MTDPTKLDLLWDEMWQAIREGRSHDRIIAARAAIEAEARAELEAALRKLASDSEITGALGTGDIHAQVRAALVSDTAGD